MKILLHLLTVMCNSGVARANHSRRQIRQISVYNPGEDPEETLWENRLEESSNTEALYNYYNFNPLDSSYNFSYDTGWSTAGRSFRFEQRLPNGDVSGEYGWVDSPDGTVRVTKYTADRFGYRARQFIKKMERKQREKQKEILIVGPIPPFLKDSHLDANPEAELSDGPDYSDLEDSFTIDIKESLEEENERGNKFSDNEISDDEKLSRIQTKKSPEKAGGNKRKVVEWGNIEEETAPRRGKSRSDIWDMGEEEIKESTESVPEEEH